MGTSHSVSILAQQRQPTSATMLGLRPDPNIPAEGQRAVHPPKPPCKEGRGVGRGGDKQKGPWGAQ